MAIPGVLLITVGTLWFLALVIDLVFYQNFTALSSPEESRVFVYIAAWLTTGGLWLAAASLFWTKHWAWCFLALTVGGAILKAGQIIALWLYAWPVNHG